MTSEEVLAKLAPLFRDVFDDDDLAIAPDMSAEDVDGWDSLSHIRMILTVEKSFGVKFTTSEVGKLQTVADLVALIRSKLGP